MENKNMKLVRAYWEDSSDEALNSELEVILSTCKTRAEKLVKIAELCLPAKTNEELYYASKSYVWAGASYRKEAIYYLEKYIESGAVYDGTPSGTREMQNIIYDLRSMSISNTYIELAQCYEGEYEFDKAIENYEKAICLTPYNPSYIVKLSTVYIKKNQLQNAKDLLQSATTKKEYGYENFRSVIDNSLADINKKIENGYVYKKRKKK